MLAALSAGLVVLGGCGEDDFANRERPARPIVVTAVVSGERVSVSPARFGAGTIDLTVTNQTAASQRVTLRSLGRTGRTLQQTTGPINPSDVTTLKARLHTGTYTLAASSGSVDPARIHVGAPRPSAQDELLQP
jgi:hypothetical protein